MPRAAVCSGAEDEDGNARVSWLERRGGDRDYPTALDPPPLPLPTIAERQHQVCYRTSCVCDVAFDGDCGGGDPSVLGEATRPIETET